MDLQNSKRRRDRFRIKPEYRALFVSLLLHAVALWLLWLLVISIGRLRDTVSLSASQSDGEAVFELADAMDSDAQQSDPMFESPADAPVDLDMLDAVHADLSLDPRLGGAEQMASGAPAVNFFGTAAYGRRFVYILDISNSMDARKSARYRRACDELIRSVSRLRGDQLFYVYLFCWRTEDMFSDPSSDYVFPTAENLKNLSDWIKYKSLGGGTDPRRALAKAFHRHPDAVFFLSDGDFNTQRGLASGAGWIDEQGNSFKADVLNGIRKLYRNVPIHAIAYENPFTKETMQEISAITGGTYRYVKTDSLKPVDYKSFDRRWEQLVRMWPSVAAPGAPLPRTTARLQLRRKSDTQRHRIQQAEAYLRDGELAFAERFVRDMSEPKEKNLRLRLKRIREILDEELGDVRLEDFQRPNREPAAP